MLILALSYFLHLFLVFWGNFMILLISLEITGKKRGFCLSVDQKE